MKIAVWSPTAFAGRKSTNLLLLALQAIEKEGEEQLVLHTDFSGSGPEHFLMSGNHRSRMMRQKEFGVEFLCRVLHCERFSKEMIRNASYSFAEGKLHILPPGSRMFYEEREEEVVSEICTIIKRADEVFHNVWIELPAGESVISEKILTEADCVIMNLAQSPEEAVKIERLPRFKREFYIFGAYEQRCIYALHNMVLLYPKLRGKCAVIPYHRGLFSACCEGEAEQFWARRDNKSDSKNADSFYRIVEKVYEKWKAGEKATDVGETKETEGKE